MKQDDVDAKMVELNQLVRNTNAVIKEFTDRVKALANSVAAKNSTNKSTDAYLAKIQLFVADRENLKAEINKEYDVYSKLNTEFEHLTNVADEMKKLEEMFNLIKPIQIKAQTYLDNFNKFEAEKK